MRSSRKIVGLMLLAACGLTLGETAVSAKNLSNSGTTNSAFGRIRGVVRDQNGAPIANALIALIRDGAVSVRQIKSGADGAFLARVTPGRYSLTAMAEGFSVVSLGNIEVEGAEEVAFRFNLVRVGSGNTLPERRGDRNQSKYSQRANRSRRTIYQQNEGTGETLAALEEPENVEENEFSAKSQTAVETFAAASENPNGGNYVGINFATVQPITENFDLTFVGQTGFGENVPHRLETTARIKFNDKHRVSLTVSGAELGSVEIVKDEAQRKLGQASFQVLDEWRMRDDLIVVVGVDYSQFVGASNKRSIAPRFGLQFDVNAKTRFNAAYTVQNEPRTWAQAADLEENRILFRTPDFESYAVNDFDADKPEIVMPRLRRLEFGFERVLDNSSNLEAAMFFDATRRGVSFGSLPLAAFDGNDEADFSSAIQNGSANGARLVYSRRLSSVFSTSIGYAAGQGQAVSSEGLSNPANLFESTFFQTLAAQLSADLPTGTKIRTIWRFTPRRAVFAIDPFVGRIGASEPSFSVMFTQGLPTLGLPVRAKAMFDARNLLDVQTSTGDGVGMLRLNSNRRTIRGGIAVRF